MTDERLDPKLYEELEAHLKNAAPEQLAKVDMGALYALLTGRPANPIWNPLPGPQTQAFDSPADEVYFGGSAGGGKSDLILGLAITRHKRSLLLRRVAKYLKGLVDRIKDIACPHGAKFRSVGWGGVLHGLPDGAEVELGGCESDEDKRNYMGVGHDLLAFDELPTFTRNIYRFLLGWNRSIDPRQRCRVVAAGNPPLNVEEEWVIDEWAPWLSEDYKNPARPGELRWYTVIGDDIMWVPDGQPFTHKGELIVPKSRTFIPADLKDNPILAATGYGARLQAMPEPWRSRLLHGFSAMNMVKKDDDDQVIPSEWIKLAQKRWRDGSGQPPAGVPLSALGVDVARGGSACLVIASRYGNWFGVPVKVPGSKVPDGPYAAARVIEQHDGQANINIDVIGIGSSAYDSLKAQVDRKIVHPINNAARTEWRDRNKLLNFVNVRAASYWKLREDLDPSSGANLALPPDKELLIDLCAVRKVMLVTGVKMEDKDDISKRIGRSPDMGDAVVMANWSAPKKKEAWVS